MVSFSLNDHNFDIKSDQFMYFQLFWPCTKGNLKIQCRVSLLRQKNAEQIIIIIKEQ